MFFIGQTRFSLLEPGSAGWKASNGSTFNDTDAYERYLFSEERIAPRMDIFLNRSLPLLTEAVEKYRIRHILSFSDRLPQKYRDTLYEVAKDFPFVVLDERRKGGTGIWPNTLARSLTLNSPESANSSEVFGTYRLDDDDLLPVNYFDQVAPYVRTENVGMIVSLGMGITGLYSEGKFYDLRRCYMPLLGLGLLRICEISSDGSVREPKHAPHNLSDRANPVILDSRELGFFWTRHMEQDSSLEGNSRTKIQAHTKVVEQLDSFPPQANLVEVLQKFPTLADVATLSPSPHVLRQVVISEPLILQDVAAQYNIDPASGNVVITLEIQGGAGTVPKNALVSFTIINLTSKEEVDPARQINALANAGISYSPNEKIGWFRYLPTVTGLRKHHLSLELPPEMAITRIRLQKWQNTNSTISIKTLYVTSENITD